MLKILGYLMLVLNVCCGLQIFHEKSKITFFPDDYSEMFGYSVILNVNSLSVGAPKALSNDNTITTGYVFNCSLHDMAAHNTTCSRMTITPDERLVYTRLNQRKFFRDDMWFGATMAALPGGDMFICAPRWAEPYSPNDKDFMLLPNGACFVQSRMARVFTPLNDKSRRGFYTDGKRKEFGQKTDPIYFYSHGQAGMSIKVTNDTILLGAPGLLMWTGGVLSYRYKPFLSKHPVLNPYYTSDLLPDDYFGYSVETGVFQRNGSTLFVAGAPRARTAYGQVYVFDPVRLENSPLNIRAKLKGPQMGSYFGASLCCVDIDNDGRADLLVGAPNFVKKDGGLPFDQGAVFVYMTRENGSFYLQPSGYLSGSSESGARFGTSIADLDDTDGDGFRDIAIGAPWENDGMGVVYIYKGYSEGLKPHYAQRILAKGAAGFGMSISKGVDVNGDNCNDLAIGAYNSRTAYLYRCVPTVKVRALIHTYDHGVRINLPHNETEFKVFFCVAASAQPSWPNAKIKLKAKTAVDLEDNRAMLTGDAEYEVITKPGNLICDEQTIEVQPSADLTKPILINFELEPDELMKDDSTFFIRESARLSDESSLTTSLLLQVIRDCGDDFICTPLLEMSLLPLFNPHTPGSDSRLGVKLTLSNKEETAYEVKVNVTLPAHPLRIPSECSLENLDLTCVIPGPILRYTEIEWDIDLEYILEDSNHEDLIVTARLADPLLGVNVTTVHSVISITNRANFSVVGKHQQNETLSISRDKFDLGGNITFVHYYEVYNYGPSDWNHLESHILLPREISVTDSVKGCNTESNPIECNWSLPANSSLPVVLTLSFELSEYANILEKNLTFKLSSSIIINWSDMIESSNLTTVLILDPKPPIWPLIVAIFAGLLSLATLVVLLHKCGFFSRKRRDQLKLLQDQNITLQDQPGTCNASSDESTQELMHGDSE